MKKIIGLFMAFSVMLFALTGCTAAGEISQAAGNEQGGSQAAGDKKLSIVTTIFPEYDWVKELLGERAADCEITMLLDNGVDLHSYQPTAADILKISSCDMLIYVGGESDEWVEDALAETGRNDIAVINLLDVLGDKVKAEEIVEGMEHEHKDADEDHDHEEGEEHDHEEELDEHVWLSLNNTEAICDEIASQLVKLDPGNADLYNSNLNAYKEKLSDLDAQYKAAVDGASVKKLLFGDRFPFRYLTEDYGLSYYAAFAGCSAESEASFETIVFLADKTDEIGLSVIMTIEGKDHRIAETVRDNTKNKDQQILTLDSMQATTSKDVEAGTTYYSIMSDNLEVLKEALK